MVGVWWGCGGGVVGVWLGCGGGCGGWGCAALREGGACLVWQKAISGVVGPKWPENPYCHAL